MVLLVYFVLACVPQWLAVDATSVSSVSETDAVIGEVYEKTTLGGSKDISFEYKKLKRDDVIRISVTSVSGASRANPILVVTRQVFAVYSWRVPLLLESYYDYDVSERTLCPFDLDFGRNGTLRGSETNAIEYRNTDVRIEMSSDKAATFNLTAELVKNFNIRLDKELTFEVGPSTPQYFKFTFPEGVDKILLEMKSPDEHCMVMSLQPVGCPVFDLVNNVKFVGVYQTVTTSGTVTIQRRHVTEIARKEDPFLPEAHSFLVVFVVRPTNRTCNPSAPQPHPDKGHETVQVTSLKSVTVKISIPLSEREYTVAALLPVIIFVAVCLLVYMLSWLIVALFKFCGCAQNLLLIDAPRESQRESVRETTRAALTVAEVIFDESARTVALEENHAVERAQADAATGGTTADDPEAAADDSENSRRNGAARGFVNPVAEASNKDEVDMVTEVVAVQQNVRAVTTVFELSREPPETLEMKYKLYPWNLITISIFYGLPVVQLVLGAQESIFTTGNQDTCFYNFKCAHPLGSLVAFNNIWSNVGYVLFGILFLIVVRIRSSRSAVLWPLRRLRVLERTNSLELRYGIPRHYGLFYAIGIALIMEGVMSGCYHICPTNINFQFDTAYMYIIACLGILKIYQQRHPDINANAHVAYCLMALIILWTLIGVEASSLAFYVIFAILVLMLLLYVSFEVYFVGKWKWDRATVTEFRQRFTGLTVRQSMTLRHPRRMFFLVILFSANAAFVIVGIVMEPNGFPSFLLFMFIVNLLLYAVYYLIMKVVSHERITPRTIIYSLLAMICWAPALYFFRRQVKSTNNTPAISRTFNEECLLLNFYDAHDIWHFLSALALFFSFMVILVMDDDLELTPRNQIVVF